MVWLNIKIMRTGTNAWKAVRQKPQLTVKVYCALFIVIGRGCALESKINLKTVNDEK